LARPGWIVRLYDPQSYDTTYQFVGNYTDLGDRESDELVVFSGMYGIDNYLVWFIHKDLPIQDFSTVNLELRLFLDADLGKTTWQQRYKIIDLRYSASQSRYYLYAINIDSAKLQTKLSDYGITSLRWLSSRSPKQVLIDVLEKGKEPIFKIQYHTHPFETDLRNFEYRSLSINDEWTVGDFINYIAEQNHFEWMVKDGLLHIGKELRAIKTLYSSFAQLPIDNITKTTFYNKYNGDFRPFEPLTHIEKDWKCVWVKHYVGKSGGTTKACWTRIGGGQVDKEIYLRSLEDDPERSFGVKLFDAKSTSEYILLGNEVEDAGVVQWVDKISVQKNREKFKVNNPNDVRMDRGADEKYPVTNTKEYICRSSPYFDHNAGLQFPVSNLEDEEGNKIVPPNRIIFNVWGKEEASVAGPFVSGNGELDFSLPHKAPEDFRLTFRNGWTWYTAENGRTIIQSANLPTQIESEDDFQFPYPGDEEGGSEDVGQYNPDGQKDSYIYMRPRILDAEGNETDNKSKVSLNAGGVGGDSNLLGSKFRVEKVQGITSWTRKTAIRAQKTQLRMQAAAPKLPTYDEVNFDRYEIPEVTARTTLFSNKDLIQLCWDSGGAEGSVEAADFLQADIRSQYVLYEDLQYLEVLNPQDNIAAISIAGDNAAEIDIFTFLSEIVLGDDFIRIKVGADVFINLTGSGGMFIDN